MEQHRYTLEEVLLRFDNCDSHDLMELAILAGTIGQANVEDNMVAVEKMSLALMNIPGLPAFYMAQAYAFLSTCEGYNRVAFTRHAASWILRARPERESLGFAAEDVGEWTNLIWEHKDEAFEEAGLLEPLEPLEPRPSTSSPEQDTPDVPKYDEPSDTKPASQAGGKEQESALPLNSSTVLPLRLSTAGPTTDISSVSAKADHSTGKDTAKQA